MIQHSSSWQELHADAHAGFLLMRNVSNPAQHPALDRLKQELEADLRARFAGQDRKNLEDLPTIAPYMAHYRRFKKTYHVLAQLDSVTFKAKPIPSVAALVEAMFMAEIKNQLLTAGHDLDQMRLPIVLDAGNGEEVYTGMRGQEQTVKPTGILMRDQDGIISSIILGPDQRTRIRPETRHVLFAVYGPVGIARDALLAHLHDIRDYVFVVAPEAEVESLQVVGSSSIA